MLAQYGYRFIRYFIRRRIGRFFCARQCVKERWIIGKCLHRPLDELGFGKFLKRRAGVLKSKIWLIVIVFYHTVYRQAGLQFIAPDQGHGGFRLDVIKISQNNCNRVFAVIPIGATAHAVRLAALQPDMGNIRLPSVDCGNKMVIVGYRQILHAASVALASP